MIVLDTNVVSELLRPAPDARVAAWFAGQAVSALRLTSITVAELRYGVARLPSGARRDALAAAIDQVSVRFADEVLPFDEAAARRYAEVVSARDRAGAPIAALDAQIAAICLAGSAALATRNTKDFVATGVELFDPWLAP